MCKKQSNTQKTKSNTTINLISKFSSSTLSNLFLIFSILYINTIAALQENSDCIFQKRIGISQIVEHPALDAVLKKMLDSLKSQGFQEGRNLTVVYDNAQGSVVTSTQIANKLLHAKLDLLVGISTPSAQTLLYEAKRLGQQVPIVFTAVSDPKAARLDLSETYPITGVTDTAHLEGLLELINFIMPQLKVLGLMYNPAEVNSVSTIERLKKLLNQNGIKFVDATVNKTLDVPQTTKSLIGKVDALYFPQDNTLVAAINSIVKIATQSASPVLPIFTNDPILIKKGILAAVGYNYDDMGIETGKVVAEILKGKPASNISVHSPEELIAAINLRLAGKLGFSIPKKLKYSKVEVIEYANNREY